MYTARIFSQVTLALTLLLGTAACHGARLETPSAEGRSLTSSVR